jgi:hypothetical protein
MQFWVPGVTFSNLQIFHGGTSCSAQQRHALTAELLGRCPVNHAAQLFPARVCTSWVESWVESLAMLVMLLA